MRTERSPSALPPGLEPYSLAPPDWRSPWRLADHEREHEEQHKHAATRTKQQQQQQQQQQKQDDSKNALQSLYPQFYPPHADQLENSMAPDIVRQGYAAKSVVQTETFSAHQMVYEQLKGSRGEPALPALGALIAAVAERSKDKLPSYGPHSHVPTQRINMNNTRNEQWVTEFANADQPLSLRAVRSIPHGYRGVKLLELVQSRRVPLDRALWLIKTVGALDIQLNRNKPGSSVASYTREWTAAVCDFVQKQVSEIAMPALAVARSAISVKFKGKSTMVDDDFRRQWVDKFSHTRKMLQLFFEEDLLDRRSFLRSTTSLLNSANAAQLAFVLFLVQDFLSEFIHDEPMAARLVAICLAKHAALSSTLKQHDAVSCSLRAIERIVVSLFVSLPDAFAPHAIWVTHRDTLTSILEGASLDPDEPQRKELIAAIESNVVDLDHRLEAITEPCQDVESVEPEELETIQTLDQLQFPANIANLRRHIFHRKRRRRSIDDELQTLFTWATTPARHGDNRIYAVAKLIELELEQQQHHQQAQTGSTSGGPNSAPGPTATPTLPCIEDAFIRWIDTQDARKLVRGSPRSLRHHALLLAELIRLKAVSHSAYTQRLIARGEYGGLSESESQSLHLRLLRLVPIEDDRSDSVTNGVRRAAVRHPASDHTALDAAEHAAKQDLGALVQALRFQQSEVEALLRQEAGFSETLQRINDNIDLLAQHGLQLRITRNFLVYRTVLALFQSLGPGSTSTTSPDRQVVVEPGEFAVLVHVLQQAKDYFALFQLLSAFLQTPSQHDLLSPILDVVDQHLQVWTAMGLLDDLARHLQKLFEMYGREASSAGRRIDTLCRRLAESGFLPRSMVDEIDKVLGEVAQSLSSSSRHHHLPSAFADVANLPADDNPQAVRDVVATLWFRYNSSASWGVVALESAVTMEPPVPTATLSRFLLEVGERSLGGLDAVFTAWISKVGIVTIMKFMVDSKGIRFKEVVSDLMARGYLRLETIINSLVLAILENDLVHVPAAASDAQLITSNVATILHLVESAFGFGAQKSPAAPGELLRSIAAASHVARLLDGDHLLTFCRLAAALVALQRSKVIDRGVQETCSRILAGIRSLPSLAVAVARDPRGFAQSFLHSSEPGRCFASLRPQFLARLLELLEGGKQTTPTNPLSVEDWEHFISGLTVWRLDIAKVEVSAFLERYDTDETIQDGEKKEALHVLSEHLLDRVCSDKGHTYLGEQIVRCYRPKATEELVSLSFRRLASALLQLATLEDGGRPATFTTLRCIGRILDTLLESVAGVAQDHAVAELLGASEDVFRACLVGTLSAAPESAAVHLVHLVSLALRCSPQPLPASVLSRVIPLVHPTISLAMSFGDQSGTAPCVPLASLLLDLASELQLAANMSSDTATMPAVKITPFATKLPRELLDRVVRTTDTPLQRRTSWDIVDYAELNSNEISNSASMDLERLGAVIVDRLSGLPLLGTDAVKSDDPSRTRGAQSNFESEVAFVGMGAAARHYRRTLVPLPGSVIPPPPRGLAQAAAAEAARRPETPRDESKGTPMPAKRKEPDVIVIDDDQVEERAPKKSKRGGKTTGGARRKSKA